MAGNRDFEAVFPYLSELRRPRSFFMAVYILLSRLTPEGRKTVKERPGRIKEVDRELENMGVKVLEQYATLGRYDFVNIVEAPDNETIGRVSVDLCSRGTVELITLPAVSVESLVESLNSARARRTPPDTMPASSRERGNA